MTVRLGNMASSLRRVVDILFWPVIGWWLFLFVASYALNSLSPKSSVFLEELCLSAIIVPVAIFLWKCRKHGHGFFGVLMYGFIFFCLAIMPVLTAMQWSEGRAVDGSLIFTALSSTVFSALPALVLALLVSTIYASVVRFKSKPLADE